MNQRSILKTWGLYALLWIFLASCFTGQRYLEYEFQGADPSWLAMFVWEGSSWGVWGVLAVAISRMTQRFPMDRKGGMRFLPLYLVAAIFFSLLHLVCNVFISRELLSLFFGQYGSFLSDLQTNFFTRICWRLFVFTVIVIVSHRWEAQRKFRSEEVKVTELRMQLVQAQLEALKMQMHPHFLFNTLHSLCELIHRDVSAAEEMVVRLGDFLRLTLNDSRRHHVPLRQELEFLQCYLEIEKIRLQERLSTHVEVDPALLNLEVPNLILQPLVENAIQHGIAPRSLPGKLEVRAVQVDSVLQIEVQDNGPGFPINANLESYFQKGLGLSNTRARLEKMYGTNQRLILKNAPSGGWIVLLEIPIQKAEPSS